MNRNSLNTIKSWFQGTNRKPLMIRGARQVGKSTLVRLAAKNLNVRLVEINCEQFTHLDAHFGTFDIKRILKEIQINLDCEPITGENTILFIDEIQATPLAIAALRYFYELMPQLAVIAAGSLLEFTLAKHSFSMPVGRVEYLFLGPLTFSEYLQATGEPTLSEVIVSYTKNSEISNATHDRLVVAMRDFLAVGGMPEAVKQWVDTHDYTAVSSVHASILQTYRDDFAKYSSGMDLVRLQRVFDFIPSSVGEKIKYTSINRDWTSRDIRHALDLLIKSGIVLPIYHSHGTGVPLGASIDDNVLKTLFLDVGLMNFSCGMRPMTLEQMRSTEFINKGKMAEQLVGQHLWFSSPWFIRPSLFYWLREGKAKNAEVDFLLSVGNCVVPIEVKSGKSGSLRSLHQFVTNKQSLIALRFDLNVPSVQNVATTVNQAGENVAVQFALASLPLYLVEKAHTISQSLLDGN